MRRALALVAALALAGCGGSSEQRASSDGRYSADVRENFLDSCLENATNSANGRAGEEQLTQTCECILGEIEAEYSEQEFTQLEQRLLGGTATNAESGRLASWSDDCAKQAGR
jgi:hypothetical protein